MAFKARNMLHIPVDGSGPSMNRSELTVSKGESSAVDHKPYV